MCYDVATQLYSKIKEAKHKGASKDEVSYLEEKLKKLEAKAEDFEHFYTSGFSHQKLPVITNEQPDEIQLFNWGLIPFWVKTKADGFKLSNKTLNARGETIFEKPSFRAAAKSKRCLVVVSGYFEHYWADPTGKNKIPYYIELKSGLPMYLSGLWEEWTDKETGEMLHTVSIVTTKANDALAKVHNRDPKNPRMLNILPFEIKKDWLKEANNDNDKAVIKELINTYPADELTIYPVEKLKGKYGVGDSEKAIVKKDYEDVDLPLF